jgi:UDP-3-O-[3-hydroxymyristoyl] glucosamine N-acyltransferase
VTLEEVTSALGGELEGDGGAVIRGVAPLNTAGPDQISFLSNQKYKSEAATTKAAAVIINAGEEFKSSCAIIRVKNSYLAMTRALEMFHAPEKPCWERDPTAVIHESAEIAEKVHIGPLCYIGPGVNIEQGCIIHAGCVIQAGCRMGKDCFLHARVVLERECVLGKRVVIQAGAVIGSDGFGFARDDKGVYHKIPQIGSVVLEDDVEIGANTAVDRATMGCTRISKGTKIDNLVQIAHNVEGSTRLGSHVMVGGQAGFVGHIKMGDRAVVTAQAGVSHDVPPGEMWSDTPARPHMMMRRIQAAMMQLPNLLKRVKKLEEKG